MFWFHTSFLPPTTTSSAAKASSKKRSKGGEGGDTGGRFQLGKAELDKACKDVKHLVFPEDFTVEVWYDELGSEKPLPADAPTTPTKKARNPRSAAKSSDRKSKGGQPLPKPIKTTPPATPT
mmetsp:Transcript_23831/g.64288  ORF Transcript_23831/g.64288 Transcript_23831/m.64288 type:complete len:122 (-) Transcript_23831:92-457(-)